MKPTKETLSEFEDLKSAAEHFGVSERTVRRWLESYDLYQPRPNFKSKLDLKKAREIRVKYKQDGVTMAQLANEYGVTVMAVSKVIHNLVYKEPETETADVSVIYNC